MRRLLLAVGVACAAAGTAGAQGSMTAGGNAVMPASGNAVMPGQSVGTGFSLPGVGKQIPKAAPAAGNPIGTALTRPYDPARPLDAFKGTGLDPKSIVAPVTSMGSAEPNVLDRLYQKLGSVVGFQKPSDPPRMNYTPGIARRNRERAEARMWRRD